MREAKEADKSLKGDWEVRYQLFNFFEQKIGIIEI